MPAQIVIAELSTSTGYLENSPIRFKPGLNCIIGARGTCKSTVVETLRFLFDRDPDRVKILTEDFQGRDFVEDFSSSRGLIKASLRDGVARCTILNNLVGDQGGEILIERSIGSPPRIYREGVQEVGSTNLLELVEIYSQGDLQRIAERPALRLQLVDRPNQSAIKELQARRDELSNRLREIGPRIKRIRSEIDHQSAEIRGLESYRRDLEALQASRPQLSPELAAQREAHQKRKEIIDTLRALGKDRVDTLAEIMRITRQPERFKEGSSLLAGLEQSEAQTLAHRLEALASFLERTRAEATRLSEDAIGPSLETLGNLFEKESEAYFQLRRQEQEINDNLRREDALRQEIGKMLNIEQRVRSLQDQLTSLLVERQDLRLQLNQAGDRLYELRLQEVEKVNSDFGDVIFLTLRQGVESGEYKAQINTLLQGSRLRNQEDVAADIAKSVTPSDLIDIVESGDARRLSELLNRELGQMTRLVSFLLDSKGLHNLEGIVFEDWLEITMYISGEPKPISQLSKGQMATALLPLILRPAPYPLVFDQPEDDLDNAFVFRALISRIRTLKLERQLIFVTHNANIPVLGDAEQVTVMSMISPQKAGPPFVGVVDEAREEILSLLEGGAEAFRRRQERYGELVS